MVGGLKRREGVEDNNLITELKNVLKMGGERLFFLCTIDRRRKKK